MSDMLKPVWPEITAELPPSKSPQDAPDYLADESRMPGKAERIFFPRTENEILALVRAADAAGTVLTIAGGRTGITGGAVPETGWLISLEGMRRFTGLRRDPRHPDAFLLRCQPGLPLTDINQALSAMDFPGAAEWPQADQQVLEELRRAPPHCFPPDPTEQTASLGGMAACNASGARTLFYGPTRDYVTGLRMALPGGGLLKINRGDCRAAADGSFRIIDREGREHTAHVPEYEMPAVKNAAGYHAAPEMDLIDLFIGAEGTLGIFTEIEIRLIPAPPSVLGALAFFPAEDKALEFVIQARDARATAGNLLALEFFDHHALDLLRDQKQRLGDAAHIPALPENAHTAVYIEYATDENDIEACAETLLTMLESAGGDPDNAWTAMDESESRRLKDFRHALPEAVNQRIGERAAQHPGLTKLGTDFAVPDDALTAMLQCYHATLQSAGFDYVIFGHIGNNHVHVNILPRDMDEYRQGKAIYLQLAETAVQRGGTVSAEHGVGKLKKHLLPIMYGHAGVEAMRSVKRLFDPGNLINPGNMFD